MKILSFIKEKITIIIIAILTLCIIGLLVGAFYLKSEISSISTDLSNAKIKIAATQRALDSVVQINAENAVVIKQLKSDSAYYDKALFDLNTEITKSSAKLDGIKILTQHAKDGDVAPVLRITIDNVQKIRKASEHE